MNFKTLSARVVGLANKMLGDELTYTPIVGSPVSIKGPFQNAWIDTEGLMSLKPTVRIALVDLDLPPAKGDQVTIDVVTYKVTESRPDGNGGTTLILQKV